jgi:Na+/H+-dicarboxylate symporter
MKKIGLIPRLIVAIVLGIIVGSLSFIPVIALEFIITAVQLFSTIMNFILPIMIVAFIVPGIAQISNNTGKLLGLTVLLSFGSLFFAAILSYLFGQAVFPFFITATETSLFDETAGLAPLFELPVEPFFTVAEGVVFALIIGLALTYLKKQGRGEMLEQVFIDLQDAISAVLSKFIIPMLPFYVFGNFLNLSFKGDAFEVIGAFLPVYILIVVQHFLYLGITFFLGTRVSGYSLKETVKHAFEAYATAFGTQSSAATVPVSIQSGKNNGISDEIADYIFPLYANTHLPGSMISVSSCVLAVLMMIGGDTSPAAMIGFFFTLALVLSAAPGVPGGAIMAALPFLGIVGIDSTGVIASLLITLYLTQDSFGTSINVTSDQAIAPIVDNYYQASQKEAAEKAIKKQPVKIK